MGGPIDLNTARARDLAALPGVDHMLARRVVLDRRLHGSFTSLQDLTRVEGFSPILLGSLADRVNVSPPEGETEPVRVTLEKLDGETDAEAPIVFAGPPRALRGSFFLRNDGHRSVYAPLVRLEHDGLRTAEGSPLGHIAAGVALHPRQRKRVVLTLRLDPFTPPGTYEANLVLGETRHPVVILVTEYLASALSPATVVLPTLAGRYQRDLVLRNDGNLPLRTGDPGAVMLEDPDLQCRVIRETIHKMSHPTWDELVGTAADELKKNLEQFDPLRIRIRNKPVRVEPGDSARLQLEIQVPVNLPRRRTFVAQGIICHAPVAFELMSWLQRQDEPNRTKLEQGDNDGE